MSIISDSWDKVLQGQYDQNYLKNIQQRLTTDLSKGLKVRPVAADIFKAYRLTPFEQVKVLIIGQEPYHQPGAADGLAFSSYNQQPALDVIFGEIKGSTGQPRTQTELTDWATQGVLLLNTTLTTVQGRPKAHHDIGWKRLTDYTIQRLAERSQPMVVMLWGKPALDYQNKFDGHKHLILKAPHPASDAYGEYSYTFRGCQHFSMCNDFFQTHHIKQIHWGDPGEVSFV